MFLETVVESAPMARFTKASRMNLEVAEVRSNDAGGWRSTEAENESAGTRTQDLRIKSALLCRLSYTPLFL
jgi:hypothetical protein